MLDGLVLLHRHIVKPPTSSVNALAPRTSTTSDFNKYHFFEGCIGPLDGTHLAVHVSAAEAIPFRNRKGTLSQTYLLSANSICSLAKFYQDGRALHTIAEYSRTLFRIKDLRFPQICIIWATLATAIGTGYSPRTKV